MSSFLKWRIVPCSLVLLITLSQAFVVQRSWHIHRPSPTFHQQQYTYTGSELFICSVRGERVGFEIPLLDLSSGDHDDMNIIVALPSTHLPDEMTTLHVYGMELTLPIHQVIIAAAIETGFEMLGEAEHCFGQVVYRPDSESLIGAIGCASQVLIPSLEDPNDPNPAPTELGVATQRILCRGMYRFVVREIKQSVPFVIAVVDELLDDPLETDTSASKTDDEEDDDDDTYDDYDSLSPFELENRLMMVLNEYVDQQLGSTEKEMTPLERAIIEENTGGIDVQRQAVEEMAAVFDVFKQYIIDLCPAPIHRYYALSFFAAEMTNLPNNVRKELLRMTQGLERLRLVLRETEQMVRMTRARKMASSITKKTDESQADLQIGQPELPPWAMAIRKGMKVEYYWNEDYEWCVGTVVDDPVLIVDELIVSVYFEDDDSTHKIPFRADEKARWRPAMP